MKRAFGLFFSLNFCTRRLTSGAHNARVSEMVELYARACGKGAMAARDDTRHYCRTQQFHIWGGICRPSWPTP